MRNSENGGIIEIIQEIREMNREKQNETNELLTGRVSHHWDSSWKHFVISNGSLDLKNYFHGCVIQELSVVKIAIDYQ